MAINFDMENNLINITSPQNTLSIQDLIDAIRIQEASDEGIFYSQIATASGKEDLGGDVYIGITVNLIAPWQIKFWEGSYIAKISGGNLVGGPSGDPVAYSAGVQVLLIQSAASTIVIQSSGSCLTQSEHDKLMSLPILSEIEASTVIAKQDGLIEALGLMQSNYYLDQTEYTEYNGSKLMTSGRIRTYSSAVSVGSSLNVLATYLITSVWDDDELTTYRVVKQ